MPQALKHFPVQFPMCYAKTNTNFYLLLQFLCENSSTLPVLQNTVMFIPVYQRTLIQICKALYAVLEQ